MNWNDFFSSIHGFCSSTLVEDPLCTFINPNEDKLLWALIGLMDRTSASHLVPNKIKQRRNAICVRAMDATSIPLNEEIFDRIFSEEWNGLLSSVELWLFLRKRVDLNDSGFCFLRTVCYFHHYFKRARTRSPLVRTHDWPSGCLRTCPFETI